MRKIIVCFLFVLLAFGGIAAAQTTDSQQYVADTVAKELTIEDLQEMEGDFYFHPGMTDQYTPNIERIRVTYIRELILEGIIPAPTKQPVGISFPDKVEGAMQPVVDQPAVLKAPASPSAPEGVATPNAPSKPISADGDLYFQINGKPSNPVKFEGGEMKQEFQSSGSVSNTPAAPKAPIQSRKLVN